MVQESKEFLMAAPLSSLSKAKRAAAIKKRFADIIMKSKYIKLNNQRSSKNKSEVMIRIQKEKQVLERRHHKDQRARLSEDETRAVKLNLQRRRKLERIALEKMEEEARSKLEKRDLESEIELVKLCGGSFQASVRWVEVLGLYLTSDDVV